MAPRILIYDIETAPILAHVWGLFDQQIGLGQVKTDRHMLSWAAKWYGEPASKVMYQDQSKAKRIEDDKALVKALGELLDEADIVITQNGKKFDNKIVNARLAIHGLPPPSPAKQIDTLALAKKHFAFTSNKLEYMSDKLNTKYKKLKHAKFSGFSLWNECLKGNKAAWAEMKKYNIHDVLATEELYEKLAPWGTGVDFNVYSESLVNKCNCGGTKFKHNGHQYSAAGKFRRFKCLKCGANHQERGQANNLLSDDKRKSLKGIA